MAKKIDAIKMAYSKVRISGMTVQPSPEDEALALVDLEVMMAELEARGICIGYNFTATPNSNDQLGVDLKHQNMVHTNLAVRLTPDFNKVAHPVLAAQASQSMSVVSSFVASRDMRATQAPSRMPLGSGYRFKGRYQRFNAPAELPPNECATNQIMIGEIEDYTEPFGPYLSGETIASFTITATSGLTISSSSNTSDVVSYRIESIATTTTFHKVTITVTTSTGRVDIRLINFEVTNA